MGSTPRLCRSPDQGADHARSPAIRGASAAVLLVFAGLAGATSAGATDLLSGMFVTPAATAELAKMCPDGTGYPKQWEWSGLRARSPVSATSGRPRIEQYRQGRLIATYTSFSDQPGCAQAGDGTDYLHPGGPASSGCGPFTRSHSWRLWAPGDQFMVYPAVYTGPYNQPWIGPQFDGPAGYNAGISHAPAGIRLQGVVQNNVRPVILLQGESSSNTLGQGPVYFDVSDGITMDNINVAAVPGASAGKAAVYDAGASNLTLSNMRVTGFSVAGANGVFGAGGYTGRLTLASVELDHNGGPNGPAHNAYIGASLTDPNFTVAMFNSWTHDAFYGHLFKSRAQNNVFIGNYFQGGQPIDGNTQAETYLLDIPNGGRLWVRNNVFVKDRAGPLSNGMSVAFMMEGASDSRKQGFDVENNTFVAFAKYYDDTHPNYPLSFLYPNVRPDSPAWPANIPARVIKNAFVGYCNTDSSSPAAYRGDIAVIESFGELTQDFALMTKVTADDAALAKVYGGYEPELGTSGFGVSAKRQTNTVGARD